MRRRQLLKLFGLLPLLQAMGLFPRRGNAATAAISATDNQQTQMDYQSVAPGAVVKPLLSVLRAQDLLDLRFEFINLKLVTKSGKQRLVRAKASSPAYLVVHFQPQHVLERTYFSDKEDEDEDNLPSPPVPALTAGDSRLVFAIPKEIDAIDYTLPALLAWERYPLSVSPRALPPQADPGQAILDKDMFQDNIPLPPTTGQAFFQTRKQTVVPVVQGERWINIASTGARRVEAKPINGIETTAGKNLAATEAGIALKPGLVTGPIADPAPFQTRIEAPFRLILSPHGYSGWAHDKQPAQRQTRAAGTRTALWHTRLGVRKKNPVGKPYIDEQDDALRTVRAIWSPDFNPDVNGDAKGPVSWFCLNNDKGQCETLTNADRNQLVHLSVNYDVDKHLSQNNRRITRHTQVKQLMLSTLGAALDLKGHWTIPDGINLDLTNWQHRATLGRDHYVKVTRKGFLCPVGHEAELITISTRELNHNHIAYLRTRYFIVCKELLRLYPKPQGEDGLMLPGRALPFQSIEIKTLETPPLDGGNKDAPFFKPTIDGSPFLFSLVATDWENRRIEFTAPMLWIDNDNAAGSAQQAALMVEQYKQFTGNLRARPVGGQQIAYGPSDEPGDTSYPSQTLFISADVPRNSNGDIIGSKPKSSRVYFYPYLVYADLQLSAAGQLSGNQGENSRLQLYERYIQYGFDAGKNPADVFLKQFQLPDQNTDSSLSELPRSQIRFNGDRSGGVATPNFDIGGLSRVHGPVGGDMDKLSVLAGAPITGVTSDGFFEQFFSEAKLLGSVPLADLLTNNYGGGKSLPSIKTITHFDSGGLPDGVVTTLDWFPGNLKSSGLVIIKSGQTQLHLQASIATDLSGKQLDSTVSGRLSNFDIKLLPGLEVMNINFEYFEFISRNGQKPDFSVKLGKIDLKGFFRFIDQLLSKIKPDGFSDPPSLDIGPSGAMLGYSLALPPIAVGAFALQNIALSASLNLPFTGDPMRVRFAFAERHNPFALTVSLFSGGGFFGIAAGADGLEVLECSLEFGGNISINLGVAKGGIVVMAGIYFKLETGNPSLTGYVRADGALEVLGLICISMSFYLGLTYEGVSGKVQGEATVSVTIHLAFFKKSVSATMRRVFSGSSGDPTFMQAMEADKALYIGNTYWKEKHANYWEQYCDAFADFEAAPTPSQKPYKPVSPSGAPQANDYPYQSW